MTSTPDPERGTYLPTGWRIVGSGAERIAERAAAAAERLLPGDTSLALYAVQCTMESVVAGRPSVERILDSITDEIRAVDGACPRLVRDEVVVRPVSRFGGLRYETVAVPGKEWQGELVWRAVHPVVAGAPITTCAVIEERPSFTRLTVRVTADNGLSSVRGYVGAGQAQPPFLRALRSFTNPVWGGAPLAAHVIPQVGVRNFVDSILGAANRDLPVAVLSPLEEGGFVVDPDDFAWDLLGRARLYVINQHQQTFALSDAVGDRRMSSYWGAVRCYMPGWSRHDDPYEHPLLVGERLADPVLRSQWLGEVGLWMASSVELPPSIEEWEAARQSKVGAAEQPEPATLPAAAPASRASRPARPGAADPAQAEDARDAAGSDPGDREAVTRGRRQPAAADQTPLLQDMIGEVRGLASLLRDLTDEVERLRTVSSVRASSTNAIERRLGRLEQLLERVYPDDASVPVGTTGRAEEPLADDAHAEDEGRPGLVDVVQDAAESYADALAFLESAYKSAADSPYEDPERVRAILEAMARVARRRRDGVLGTSLREAFSDLGIDYRAAIAKSTPARLREQYRFPRDNGDVVEAEEHIALGNTYDPRRCLRVYFSSRVPNEPRFIIGHVGRHFHVQSTT